MNIRQLLLGWDLLAAFAVATALALLLPEWLLTEDMIILYGVGTSVLAIVFSLSIAAFAVLVAAGADDFLLFLEEEGHFSVFVLGFKITLVLLFVSLVYCLTLQTLTTLWNPLGLPRHHKLFVVIFGFLLSWSLGATLTSTFASIRYAQFRARFLKGQTTLARRSRKDEDEA